MSFFINEFLERLNNQERREEARRRTMLRYYEPLPSKPLFPRVKRNFRRERLKADIRRQIKDENEAYSTYMRLAIDAEDLREADAASTLRSIASDEYRHRRLLEEMLMRL